MSATVEIIEVSPRDGLQNESEILPTSTKIDLISRIVSSGFRRVEVTSFVHPRLVPQMADAEEVLRRFQKPDGVRFATLVLNEKGLDRAIACGVDEVNLVVVATDTFGLRNQRQTVEQGIATVKQLARRAKDSGMFVTVTIGATFGCPFEGEVPRNRIVHIAERITEDPVDELAFADTIGVAVPTDIASVIDVVTAHIRDLPPLRLHLHDTRHTGVANAYAGWQSGVVRFDASFGGSGGCPFAPNATGNVATEDLLYLFNRMGVSTGIELTAVSQHIPWLEAQLKHPLPGALTRSGGFPAPSATSGDIAS